MRSKMYFEKTGKIYGVCTTSNSSGREYHIGYIFYSFEKAEEWQAAEQKGEWRRLMSKEAAVRLCGSKNIDIM